MIRKTDFYIDGAWVSPLLENDSEVIDPADETAFAVISLGSNGDVDQAVEAARASFPAWSETNPEERRYRLEKLATIYEARYDEMTRTISREMGAPMTLAAQAQARAGHAHIRAFIDVLHEFTFEHPLWKAEDERIVYDPIGVCGLITPWNWPINQVTLKVVPALAAGCTVVLKPSEIAPLSAMLFAEMIHQAGFPKGVFNLVNGDGPTVGAAMSRHPGIDMMSFTGSTRTGINVTKEAADTVKRVTLELGGKSPNIVFADADLSKVVATGTAHCFRNSGQSCNAPTRMLVERRVYDEAVRIAVNTAAATQVGASSQEGPHIGPLASIAQFQKVQGLIETAIAEGGRLVAGGLGRPEGFNRGYFVRPTVFADVTNDMTIAREEVFGPVLSIIPFEDEDDAIRIAHDSRYGLASYVQTGDPARARRVARRLRTGTIQINGAARAPGSPYGGFKQSGNGREGGRWGFEEFLEVKVITGWPLSH